MRLKTLALLLFFWGVCSCVHQTDGIIGTIVDSSTLQPIANAQVTLSVFDFQKKSALNEDPIVYSDERGVYQWFYAGTLLLVNGGGNGYPSQVKITVTKTGYQTFVSPDYISLQNTVTYNVKLTP